MTAVGWGKQLPFFPLYPSTVNFSSHLNRLFQRWNGGVYLALHVSAPRELRPTICARIEETQQDFFSPDAWDVRSNRVNGRHALCGAHQASGLVNVRLSLRWLGMTTR
jgi:hypothetical protein